MSVETGEILETIDMRDVRQANPFLHIFNLQVDASLDDISHGNDIEPLPEALASLFPGFAPGDLLVSFRTQNLVFVLDPETLKVKWWRIGAWDRQHDPDWEVDGRIGVYSNNAATAFRSGDGDQYSDIVAIDPVTMDYSVILRGDDYGFFSAVNGDHQRTAFGTRMVTSTTQGWAFEVDQDGKIVSAFLNVYDAQEEQSLNISEAHHLPLDYFETEFWKTCAN